MPRSRAERFLSAFHGVEALLRARLAADRRLRFYDLVNEVAKLDPTVAAFRLDLMEFADLRNAIVHEGTGSAIANPYPDTVLAMERIASILASPPKLIDVIRVEMVETCGPETLVLEAARTMRRGDFSQVPVVVSRRVVALLTTETVTRFVSVVPDDDLPRLPGVLVSEVLPHAERDDNFEVVTPESTTFEAIELFRTAADAGRSLDAILAVDEGRLVTIATPFDLPLLIRASHLG
jgi:predicted transcriptional regulator